MPATKPIAILRVRGLECWAVSGLGCGSLIAPALAQITDVAPDARSDHGGTLLRFTDHGQVAEVQARLKALGYESEPAYHVDPREVSWYRADDLSREEADVLARRLVPEFARHHAVDAQSIGLVQERVAKALFARFAGNDSQEMGRPDAIAAAVIDLVGTSVARELGQFVHGWLERGVST